MIILKILEVILSFGVSVCGGGGGGGYGLVVFYWGHFSHFEGLLVFWSFRERERERERERFCFLKAENILHASKEVVFLPGKKKKNRFLFGLVFIPP